MHFERGYMREREREREREKERERKSGKRDRETRKTFCCFHLTVLCALLSAPSFTTFVRISGIFCSLGVVACASDYMWNRVNRRQWMCVCAYIRVREMGGYVFLYLRTLSHRLGSFDACRCFASPESARTRGRYSGHHRWKFSNVNFGLNLLLANGY